MSTVLIHMSNCSWTMFIGRSMSPRPFNRPGFPSGVGIYGMENRSEQLKISL